MNSTTATLNDEPLDVLDKRVPLNKVMTAVEKQLDETTEKPSIYGDTIKANTTVKNSIASEAKQYEEDWANNDEDLWFNNQRLSNFMPASKATIQAQYNHNPGIFNTLPNAPQLASFLGGRNNTNANDMYAHIFPDEDVTTNYVQLIRDDNARNINAIYKYE